VALSLVPSAGSLLHDCSWRMRSCVPNLTCTCKQKPLHNTNTVHACPASQYVHPSSPRAPQSVAAWRLFESCQMYRENHIEFPLEFGICIMYIFTYVLDYIYTIIHIYIYIYGSNVKHVSQILSKPLPFADSSGLSPHIFQLQRHGRVESADSGPLRRSDGPGRAHHFQTQTHLTPQFPSSVFAVPKNCHKVTHV